MEDRSFIRYLDPLNSFFFFFLTIDVLSIFGFTTIHICFSWGSRSSSSQIHISY